MVYLIITLITWPWPCVISYFMSRLGKLICGCTTAAVRHNPVRVKPNSKAIWEWRASRKIPGHATKVSGGHGGLYEISVNFCTRDMSSNLLNTFSFSFRGLQPRFVVPKLNALHRAGLATPTDRQVACNQVPWFLEELMCSTRGPISTLLIIAVRVSRSGIPSAVATKIWDASSRVLPIGDAPYHFDLSSDILRYLVWKLDSWHTINYQRCWLWSSGVWFTLNGNLNNGAN